MVLHYLAHIAHILESKKYGQFRNFRSKQCMSTCFHWILIFIVSFTILRNIPKINVDIFLSFITIFDIFFTKKCHGIPITKNRVFINPRFKRFLTFGNKSFFRVFSTEKRHFSRFEGVMIIKRTNFQTYFFQMHLP